MSNGEGSAKPTKSGLASFQASGRFLASYDDHRDARDAPSTSRRHRGGDTYGINRSGVDDARKLEEGVRGLRYAAIALFLFSFESHGRIRHRLCHEVCTAAVHNHSQRVQCAVRLGSVLQARIRGVTAVRLAKLSGGACNPHTHTLYSIVSYVVHYCCSPTVPLAWSCGVLSIV